VEPASAKPASYETAAEPAVRKAGAAAAKATATTAAKTTTAEMTSAALRERGGRKEKQHTSRKAFHCSLLLPEAYLRSRKRATASLSWDVRELLLFLSLQPRLRHWMETSSLARRLSSRFVAGETLAEALSVA